MLLIIMLVLSLVISIVAIRIGISLSHNFGIVDHPSEHKQHTASTPFVGGLGIFLALVIALKVTDYFQISSDIHYIWIVLACSVIFLTGFADDVWRLDYKLRLLVQAGVASVMALWGGVLVVDLGSLFSSQPFDLGILALPFTVFATIGVINALNMIDGIDGLSGSVSFVSLLMIAIVAFMAGEKSYLALSMILMGGVVGFLIYNLRIGSRRRALVFLGDNGSMLLGFLFSWILIGLSQGESPAMTPVTALWILAVPLMDAVGVMIRRIYYRHSAFKPDRNHLHHLLIRAGFRTQDVVYIVAMIQFVFGSIGVIGLYSGISESWMFMSFILIFVVYCYVIARPWRFVPTLRTLHTRLGLASADCRGIFIGNYPARHAAHFVRTLIDEFQSNYDFDLHIYEVEQERREERILFATVELFLEEDDASLNELKGLVNRLKNKFKGYTETKIRQLIKRDHRNDRRIANKLTTKNFRDTDRRTKHEKQLIYRAKNSDGSLRTLVGSFNQPEVSII